MPNEKITFATIVATPSDTSWSQAYTAGKLYAVLSLEHTDLDSTKLAALGKDIINALVEEYFTLEIKDLTTIKTAIIQTTTKIQKETTACLVVISIVNNILYAFSFGGGKVIIRRKGKIGTILSVSDRETSPSVHAVSGFLQDGDTVILQTKQFESLVSSDDLLSFSTPTDAAEILSPKIHGATQGGASAIVLSYQESPTLAIDEDILSAEEKEIEEKEKEEIPSPLQAEVASHIEKKKSFSMPKIHVSFPKMPFKLPKKTFLFLLVPLILFGILLFSLYTTKQRQENEKIQSLFQQVYPAAEKKYNEGQALLSLNKELAQDDFKKAESILSENIDKFPKESEEYKKIAALFETVQSVTDESTSGTALTAKEATTSDSPLLSALLKNITYPYAVNSETDIYLGSNTDIKTPTGKTIVENDDGWEKIGGLGTFGTNVYILDKTTSQILKYVSGDAESKTTYATSPAFAKATAIAIDGSIYVLSADGTIKKYTRGKEETFALTGLETPLKNPTRIYTNPDIDNLSILDKGNSRIVVFNKQGAFQNSYAATIIKDAVDFDVQEGDKKIYILSSGKVYEIDLP